MNDDMAITTPCTILNYNYWVNIGNTTGICVCVCVGGMGEEGLTRVAVTEGRQWNKGVPLNMHVQEHPQVPAAIR